MRLRAAQSVVMTVNLVINGFLGIILSFDWSRIITRRKHSVHKLTVAGLDWIAFRNMSQRRRDICACGFEGRYDNVKRHKNKCAALQPFSIQFTSSKLRKWLKGQGYQPEEKTKNTPKQLSLLSLEQVTSLCGTSGPTIFTAMHPDSETATGISYKHSAQACDAAIHVASDSGASSARPVMQAAVQESSLRSLNASPPSPNHQAPPDIPLRGSSLLGSLSQSSDLPLQLTQPLQRPSRITAPSPDCEALLSPPFKDQDSQQPERHISAWSPLGTIHSLTNYIQYS